MKLIFLLISYSQHFTHIEVRLISWLVSNFQHFIHVVVRLISLLISSSQHFTHCGTWVISPCLSIQFPALLCFCSVCFPTCLGLVGPFWLFFLEGFSLQTTFFADFYAGAGSLKFLFPLNPGEMMNKTLNNSTFLLINSVTNLFLTIAGRSGGEAVRGAWYSRSQLCAGEFIRQSC